MTHPTQNPEPSGTAFAGRLAIVLSHPVQYYSPWFVYLTQSGWNLRVFYLWDFGVTTKYDPGFKRSIQWDVDLLSGYSSEFVPNTAAEPGTHHFSGLRNPALRGRLSSWNPDVVLVFGYKYRTHLELILRSAWPLVFRGDSHLIDHPRTGLVKHLLLSRIFRRFATFTYVGQANRSYFRHFGVPDSKLFFAPHAVDTARYQPSPAAHSEAHMLRKTLGLEGRRVILYAGKLAPQKQPVEFLQAFIDTAPRNWTAVFVGDGAELKRLQRLAAQNPERDIRFLPFANQSEMPARYLLADIFVLPSIGLAETWGLAVQEAMHVGTPALVSNRVGCQQDLVLDGETGWVFKADSPADFRHTLARATADCEIKRDAFSAAALRRVCGYTYREASLGLREAACAALAISRATT